MSAVPTTEAVVSDQTTAAANQWLLEHYDELASRARAIAPRKDPLAREEAVAEMIALIVLAVHRAAKRDRLDQITPFWLATFASRHIAQGRLAAGYSSRCAMADATRVKRGVNVMSLDANFDFDDPDARRLSHVLADRRANDPVDVVRRDYDYDWIFDQEQISEKGRRTFEFLAQSQGAGRQMELAAALMVSPGRVTQIKRELAGALSRHGYSGPLGPRPGSRRH